MSSAKRKGLALKGDTSNCDQTNCRTPDGQGGYDCWAGDNEPFECADGWEVVETGETRTDEFGTFLREITCCLTFSLAELSRMADYPTVLPSTVHDHAMQLESLTNQLSAMTRRVEDLEARCPALAGRRSALLCDGLTDAESKPSSDADAKTHVIKMAVSLPYTVDEFDAIKQVVM
jgi:hypothetical protein